jgi:PAS domain S-box-containing protein
MSGTLRHTLQRYSIALLTVVAALSLTLLLQPWIGSTIIFPLFFAAVAISAWFGGFGPALLSIIVSALIIDFVFLLPSGQLSLNTGDFILLAVMFLTALLISSLSRARSRGEIAQSQLAAIVQTSGDAIFTKTLDAIVQSWNPAAERMYGYTQAEMRGRSVSVLVPPERPGELAWIMEQLRRGETVQNFETVRIRKDGTRLDVSVTISPIRDAAGNVTAASTIARDVTEQKRTAAALREANQAMQALLDYSPLPIIVFDRDGIVQLWSPAAERTFGWSADEVIGRPLPTVPPDKQDEFQATREAVARGETLIGIDASWRKKDGTPIDINFATAGIRDSQGQIARLITIARDVTERRRAEQEQRFLATASAALVSSLDYETTLQNLVEAAASFLCDWCTVDVMEGKQIWRLAFTHTDPDKQILLREMEARFPPRPDYPHSVMEVMRTQNSLLFSEVPEERLRALAQSEEHLTMLQALAPKSFMGIPLRARGRTFGMIGFVSSSRRYTEADLALAEELANRASLAVDNALLYREVSEQRERLRVTLTSIGDAVIATDTRSRVTFINPIAERLTGWTQVDAAGRDINEVFNIINEQTRQPVPNPVERVLREGLIVGLANHTVLIGKSGVEHPIDDSGAPIRNHQGSLLGAVLVFRDITERRRTERALAESEARFRMMADTAPVMIWTSGVDALRDYFNRPWLEFTGRNMEQESGNGWSEGIHPADYPRYLDTYLGAFQTRQGFEIEYRLRRADGEYRWVYDHGVPRFDTGEQFAGYIGSCIDITERKRAEDEQHFLDEVSIVLASSLDYQSTLNSVARLAVPTVADWCAVHVAGGDGTLQQVAVAHVDPAKVEWAHELERRYPPQPDAPTGIYQVMRTGRTWFIPEVTEAMIHQTTSDPEILDIIHQIGFTSIIIAPLIASGQTLGTLQLVSAESKRHYDEGDVALAEELARRAATAIANARLYDDTQRARLRAEEAAQRTTRLQGVTAALSESFSPSEVADVIINQVIAASGAVAGSMYMLSPDGATLVLVRAVGFPESILDRWRRFPLDAPTPLAEAVRTGQSIFLATFEERVERYPDLVKQVTPLLKGAATALPLIVGGQVAGAIGFSYERPRSFAEEDRSFMLTIAQQCSQAVERARLYAETKASAETLQKKVDERTRELQEAVEQARSADRAKSTLLSTVSHEMRTPLSSIIGFSNLILSRKPEQEKLMEYVTFVNIEARRLASLINDFLDLQRIEAGREVFRFADLDMAALLRDIVNKQELGETSGHTLRLDLNSVPHIYADSDRIRQVIVNLLSNAIKYSSAGGEIVLSLRATDSEVIFSIRDNGIGIPPEELGRLFERFYRGDAAERQRIRGTGLGLALCRELIQAHHGRIWAESEGANKGATFSFALPIARAMVVSPLARPGSEEVHDPARKTIVVVEDDPSFAAYLADRLQPEGYTVQVIPFEAATPQSISLLSPSLIVLDIFKGEQQPGWALLTALKQSPETRAIPVLVCSILRAPQQAWYLGASAYVSKPVDESFLMSEIRRLIGPSPRRILIVDDDPQIRTLLSDLLHEAGYRPEIAEDGQGAIERLSESQWPDLIILDLMMPNVDGFAVLEWIRADQYNTSIPVIAFTAAELTPEQQALLKARASALTIKANDSPQQLLNLIRQLTGEV